MFAQDSRNSLDGYVTVSRPSAAADRGAPCRPGSGRPHDRDLDDEIVELRVQAAASSSARGFRLKDAERVARLSIS